MFDVVIIDEAAQAVSIISFLLMSYNFDHDLEILNFLFCWVILFSCHIGQDRHR